MVSFVGRLSPFSIYTQIQEGVQVNTKYKKIKTFLKGKTNSWRELFLGSLTTWKVIQAALSFFNGSFFSAICQFSIARFLSILRREITDLTNLNKATREYNKQNKLHRLKILELGESVLQFKAEINNLEKQAKKFEASNEEYAYNNSVCRQILDNIGSCNKEFVDDFRKLYNEQLRSGVQLSRENRRVYENYLEGAERLSQQAELLKKIQTDLQEDHTEQLDQLGSLLKQVQTTGDKQLKAVQEADKHLQKTKKDLEANRTTLVESQTYLASLKKEASSLKKHINCLEKLKTQLTKNLEDLKKELQHLSKLRTQLQGTTNTLNEAARRSARSTDLATKNSSSKKNRKPVFVQENLSSNTAQLYGR